MANNNKSAQNAKSHEGLLRPKRNIYKKGSSRRVSCKDLGNGDCEGWLWKKTEKHGLISRDWKKNWFTLKEKSLYYYKAKEDEMAQGIFRMPAFTVSPATDKESSKKFSFKAAHPRHGTFLFASERKEDMVKWMNMLQVACLPDFNPRQLNTINSVADDYSGSDNDDDVESSASMVSHSSSSLSDLLSMSPSSIATSPVLLPDIVADEPSFPVEVENTSAWIGSTLGSTGREKFERSIKRKSKQNKLEQLCSHLASLQRTLKDREGQLKCVDEFLNGSSTMTSTDIQRFQSTQIASDILMCPNRTSDA